MPTETKDIRTQLKLLDKYYEESVKYIIDYLSNPNYLYYLTSLRLEDGYKMFGSAGFDKSKEELVGDTLEELADAIIYTMMWKYRDA